MRKKRLSSIPFFVSFFFGVIVCHLTCQLADRAARETRRASRRGPPATRFWQYRGRGGNLGSRSRQWGGARPAGDRPARSKVDAPARPCSAGRCVRKWKQGLLRSGHARRAGRGATHGRGAQAHRVSPATAAPDAAFTAAPRWRQVAKLPSPLLQSQVSSQQFPYSFTNK